MLSGHARSSIKLQVRQILTAEARPPVHLSLIGDKLLAMRPFFAVFAACCAAGLAGCAGPSSVQTLSVTSVTPTVIAAGSGATPITVTGTDFNAHMSIELGTTVLSTTFVSGTSLTATVPAALPSGTYAVSVVDAEGGFVGTATLATSFNVSVTNPSPTVTSATPTVFIAGTSGATAMVVGSGFVVGTTTAMVDTVPRAVTVQDSMHLSVALTADDLLYATQRMLVIANPAPKGGTAVPVALTVTNDTRVATAYTAYGDSITYGYELADRTQAYPALLASAFSLPLNDQGGVGDMACDVFNHHILNTRDEFTTNAGQAYTLMIGTNDTYEKGVGAYEAVYNECDQAALSWLALSRPNKLVAGDAGLVATGGCGRVPDAAHDATLYCAAAGNVTGTVTTAGSPIYLWYLIDDNAPAGAALQVTVDGAPAGSVAAATNPSISTYNHTSASIALLRLPVAAGPHTVVLAASAGAGVLALGTVPASHRALSFVVSGDVPVMRTNSAVVTTAVQLQFTADVRANVALLQSDGLDVRIAPDRQYMQGSPSEMIDTLHPNLLGHQELAAAFKTGFVGLNSGSGPYAAAVVQPSTIAQPSTMVQPSIMVQPSTMALPSTVALDPVALDPVALDTGGENTLPAVPLSRVQPNRAGTSYRLAAASPDLVTIANTSAHTVAATVLAPVGERMEGAPGGVTLAPGEVVTLFRQALGDTVTWLVLHAATVGAGVTPAQP